MEFVTYKNTRSRQVTIHQEGCGQIRKKGGHHSYSQGEYLHHGSYDEAKTYSRKSGFAVKDCSYCRAGASN